MSRKGRRPQADAPLAARPGSGMLMIPPSSADPLRLAEESIEKLKREHPPRPVKTSKKKPKRRGGIGAPRPSHSQGTS